MIKRILICNLTMPDKYCTSIKQYIAVIRATVVPAIKRKSHLLTDEAAIPQKLLIDILNYYVRLDILFSQ